MISVPTAFAANRVRMGGEAGERWIASLPALIRELCDQWDLEIDDGKPWFGELSLVIPVASEGQHWVLKVGWVDSTTADEAKALATWKGQGAVRLLAARPEVGALLLERLDPQRSLRGLEVLEAGAVAGGLIGRLAIPAPRGIRRLEDLALTIAESLPVRQKRLGRPVPQGWLAEAIDTAHVLGPGAADRLVHGDLYYGNVLSGTREPWLAVDPKPVAGDPEFSVPELLWDDRADAMPDAPAVRRLLATVVDHGMLDAELTRAWIVVRCVDYWLWGLANGLTEDPVRCRRVLEAVI